MKSGGKLLLAIIAIIFFPITCIYCAIHTMGKELRTFIGSIVLCAIGFILSMYVFVPHILTNYWNIIITTIKTIFNF